MQIQTEKMELRRKISAVIASLSAARRAEADRAIPIRFQEWLSSHTGRPLHDAWQGQTVLAFMPLPDEPEITPMLVECLAGGGRLVLPRVGSDRSLVLYEVTDFEEDLQPGSYGILEPHAACRPVEPAAMDAILVPGRAFTTKGYRLGRGKAYYDTLLRDLAVPRVAVVYDCQVVEHVPVEEHDQPVDVIVTPTRILQTGC